MCIEMSNMYERMNKRQHEKERKQAQHGMKVKKKRVQWLVPDKKNKNKPMMRNTAPVFK
nr:hypothetical protein P5627_01375 [Bacillus safensis]